MIIADGHYSVFEAVEKFGDCLFTPGECNSVQAVGPCYSHVLFASAYNRYPSCVRTSPDIVGNDQAVRRVWLGLDFWITTGGVRSDINDSVIGYDRKHQ